MDFLVENGHLAAFLIGLFWIDTVQLWGIFVSCASGYNENYFRFAEI